MTIVWLMDVGDDGYNAVLLPASAGHFVMNVSCYCGWRLCSSVQRGSDVHGSGAAWSFIKLLMAEGSARGTCSTEPWPLVAADRPQTSISPVCILFTSRMVRLKLKNDLYGARQLVSSEIWCRDGMPRCMRVCNGDRAWCRLFKFHVARTVRYEYVIDRFGQ